jgi:hypothetical protein
MRKFFVFMLLVLLAACNDGSKDKTGDSGKDRCSRDEMGRCADPPTRKGGSGKTEGANDKGSSGGTDGGSKTGTGEGTNPGGTGTGGSGEERVDFDKPVARCEVEGKVTVFSHVMALWDEPNHAVRVVASSQAIPDSAIARLRNGEPLEGEVPHMILSWILEEGATKLTKAGAENYFYDFHWLTSLSPMSLRNIGKEAVRELSGSAKVGEKVRFVIEFRSEKVKDAPAEKIHFDFVQELTLK